jgi:hypothetical protein
VGGALTLCQKKRTSMSITQIAVRIAAIANKEKKHDQLAMA